MTTPNRRERHNSPTPPNTHGTCGATWTGTAAAHCSGCCRTFSSATLFDRHRSNTGERGRCHDPATVNDRHGEPVFEYRDGMWRGPEMTEEQKIAAFGARTAS